MRAANLKRVVQLWVDTITWELLSQNPWTHRARLTELELQMGANWVEIVRARQK